MITKKHLQVALGAALIAGIPMAASAHHSHAMFDDTKLVTFQGTVKNFSFANPHVYLFVDVQASDGSVTTYPVEMSYAQNMVSQGITGTTFKTGDKVSVSVNPFRNGRPGGFYIEATDAQGIKHSMDKKYLNGGTD